MVFWILLILLVAVIVLALIAGGLEDGPFVAFGYGLFALLLGGMASAAILGLFMLIPSERIEKHEYELRAIGTSSSVEGRFYLGSGYIDGKRTLNYIQQNGGWSEVRSADADVTRIFEDSSSPSVIEYREVYENPWVISGAIWHDTSFDFHIPADSILENYTIDNN